MSATIAAIPEISVAGVIEMHGGELPTPGREDGRQGKDRGTLHIDQTYMIAAGGAGSSGRPAFVSGSLTIKTPSNTITTRPTS